MKKILSLAGIVVMAAIASTSAFAGNFEQQELHGNTSVRLESMEQIGPTDASYSQYGYYGKGGHRGGPKGGHRGGPRGGHGNGGHW